MLARVTGVPFMSANAQTDGPVWPADLLDASEVRGWIATALPDGGDRRDVTGPVEIYQVKAWGVTARFVLGPPFNNPSRSAGAEADVLPAEDVVFKASALPLVSSAPAVSRLLAARAPRHVPRQLAWTRRGTQTGTLFRPFAGRSIGSEPSRAGLEAIARTMARIQDRVATAAPESLSDLPRLPVGRLPALCDDLVADVRDHHLASWRADDGVIARRFGLPDDPLGVLVRYRSRVRVWAEELQAGGWPDTVDHVDLQTGNAVRLADGAVLIYDWEEATVGCPFFSIDRLLGDARDLDRGTVEVGADDVDRDDFALAANLSGEGGALAGSPTERAVRAAYLDAVPWRTREDRERAFDLALCLSPLKFAHECKAFAVALGHERASPALIAFCLSHAVQRWQSLEVGTAAG